jgi:hypothetical protein
MSSYYTQKDYTIILLYDHRTLAARWSTMTSACDGSARFSIVLTQAPGGQVKGTVLIGTMTRTRRCAALSIQSGEHDGESA